MTIIKLFFFQFFKTLANIVLSNLCEIEHSIITWDVKTIPKCYCLHFHNSLRRFVVDSRNTWVSIICHYSFIIKEEFKYLWVVLNMILLKMDRVGRSRSGWWGRDMGRVRTCCACRAPATHDECPRYVPQVSQIQLP